MESQMVHLSHRIKGLAPESNKRELTILMADGDGEVCFLLQEALQESSLKHNLTCFENGKELLNYLQRTGKYKSVSVPQPDLIILDLNMVIMDGRTALQEIKKDPGLKDIHVMVLTESREVTDLYLCYGLGADTFFTKGEWLSILVEVIKTSGEYWFDFVRPRSRKSRHSQPNSNQKRIYWTAADGLLFPEHVEKEGSGLHI
jgi:CheY-like chemotaxis protein